MGKLESPRGAAAPRRKKTEAARPDVDVPRRTRGQRTKELTRRKLIAAAVRVMAEKGVEGTAIGDITEAADVGVGSFYNHFSSKQEIVEIVFRVEAAELAVINDSIFAQEEDPAVAISYIHKLFLSKATADPVWGWFLVHAASVLPQMQEIFAAPAAAHIRIGLERKRFTNRAVDAAVRVILASLMAAMRDLLEKRITPAQANQVSQCLLMMLGVSIEESAEIARRKLPARVQRLLEAGTSWTLAETREA